MRTLFVGLAALMIFALTGCGEPFDPEKERAEIIEVINRETDAYLERDFEAMFDTHVQDSLNMRLTAGADSYVFLQGWEDVSRHMMGEQTEDILGPDLHISVEKSNYRMKIFPQSAFVVCDQLWTSKYDDDVTEIESIQVRFLEKIEGEWKISFVSFIGTSGYEMMEEMEELLD
jgi:hypothetical protein